MRYLACVVRWWTLTLFLCHWKAELRSVLSQWDKEDLAPLTQMQVDSWMDLAAGADERPMPLLVGSAYPPYGTRSCILNIQKCCETLPCCSNYALIFNCNGVEQQTIVLPLTLKFCSALRSTDFHICHGMHSPNLQTNLQ